MFKHITVKKKLSVFVVALFIISLATGTYFSYNQGYAHGYIQGLAQAGGTPTIDGTEGIYNFDWVNATAVNVEEFYLNNELLSHGETASYIIFKDGNIIKARNGSTGLIDFSGTDATTVIQAAINNGALIFFKEGTYDLTVVDVWGGRKAALSIPNNTKIVGSGMGKTILKLANNQAPASTPTYILFVEVIGGEIYENIEIKDLTLDGNKVNQNAPVGVVYETNLLMIRTKNFIIRNVESKNNRVWGMGIYGTDIGGGPTNGLIENVWVHNNGLGNANNFDAGIFVSFHTRHELKIKSSYSYNNSGDGIHLEDSPDSVTIEDLSIYNNSFNGIKGTYGAWIDDNVGQFTGHLNIFNNRIYNNNFSGITLDSVGDNTKIIGNSVFYNGRYGIECAAHYRSVYDVAIQDNTVYNNGDGTWYYGIMFYGYGVSEKIIGGIITGNRAFDTRAPGSKTQKGGYSDNVHMSGVLMMGNDWSNNMGVPYVIPTGYIIISRNIGFITEKSGTKTCADNENIAHGLAKTPTFVSVNPMNDTYGSVPVIATVDWSGVDPTNIRVGLYWTNGTAISSDVILVSWYAKYEP